MKKKKLLTGILAFMLVFSFLLASSSMALAEETIPAENTMKQEITDIWSQMEKVMRTFQTKTH